MMNVETIQAARCPRCLARPQVERDSTGYYTVHCEGVDQICHAFNRIVMQTHPAAAIAQWDALTEPMRELVTQILAQGLQ